MANSGSTQTPSDPLELSAKFERNRHLLPFFAAELPPLAPVTWPELDSAQALERAKGCLLGLAMGEAIGSTVEYLLYGDFKPVSGPVGGGPLNLQPGEWTDGTAMALCLAESLIEVKNVDQYDLMLRLQGWLERGENTPNGQSLAVGATTQAAIESFITDDDPSAGPVDDTTAGNGSLIRLAPLAIAYAPFGKLAGFFAAKQSRATHGTLECLDACELFANQLVDVLSGADMEAATRPRVMKLAPNTLAINGGEWKSKPGDRIRPTAYVIDTLEAGLWSVWNSGNFRDAVLLAANLGGDAAGTAAVAGQLAGSLYGASAIPEDWLKTLSKRARIEQLAIDLFQARAAIARR